jgi:putative ABC transport system permease protein
MGWATLVWRSSFRNRLRALLTACGAAIAIVAFLFLRTFINAYYAGVESSAADRVVVRNKISLIFPLPLSYVSKVEGLVGGHGVVAYNSWFGARYPKDEHAFFANYAADDKLLDVYPELHVPADALADYRADRRGALVGRDLATKYGWKPGDSVTLSGTIYPGDWQFTVRAIYDSDSPSFPVTAFIFHWQYLNESLTDERRDRVGMIVVKVDDAALARTLPAQIDREFASSLAETRTESEVAFQRSFLSMASAIIGAIRIVSGVILAILMLILGNTLAMSARERTTEYAAMRAIGFQPRHVVALVLGEAIVVAALGVALGVGLARPVVHFFGATMVKQMNGFITDFRLKPGAIALAVIVPLVLGVVAAAAPAWRAGRLRIADALRRVE